MKKIKLLCAILFFSVGLGVSNGFTQDLPEVKMYKTGNAKVWAIADGTGERGLDIFDSSYEKVIKQYIPSGKIPSAVMTYLIKTGEELILIDTGFGKGLMEGLEKLNIKPEDITLVLITHMHGDHIGGLVKEDRKVFPNAAVKIGRDEYDFWTDDKSLEKLPARKANFDTAKNVVSVYGDLIEIFNYEDMVSDNIKAMDASGHTPGQTAFLLESAGEKFLFVADIVHAEALQFPRPDISNRYDMDPRKAAEARKRFFKMAAEENIPIAGAHLSYPGVGEVKKAGKKDKDGYVFMHK